MTGPRRTGISGRLAALGGLLLLSAIPAASSAQAADDSFVGYQAQATGTAFSAFPELPALLPVEVPFEATVSLATATLSSGGEGFGRASTFFPGSLTTGIRPLIEIGAGVRLPLPDYPLVVESHEYDGARHADVPGITMSSDVDPDRAVAVAAAGAIVVPAAVGVRSIHTESRSELLPGRITATSTTTLKGIEVAGTLTIDSVVSVASVTSDGVTSRCSGGVTISGAKVDGTPATIDDDGIHLDQQAPVGGVGAGPALDQVLTASGLRARTLGGVDGCTEAFGSRTTSGILVTIPLPEAAVIPAAGGLNVVLGSTAAAAGASTIVANAVDAGAGSDLTPTFGDVVTRLPGPFTGGGTLQPLGPAATAGDGPVATGFPTDQAAYVYDGVPAGLVIGLILLAVAGSVRVRRYMLRIIGLIGSP